MRDVNKLKAEALEEWRAHPVTEWLLAVMRQGAATNKAGLQASLWASGECDQQALGRVKAQEELIEDLTDGTSDDWNSWAEHFKHQRD